MRTQQQGEYRGLILELKLCHGRFHTYYRMSVGQFEPQLRRQRNHFTGPSEPQQSLPVCCLTISMPMSVQYRCAAWAVSALVAKSSDLIGRIVYWDPKNWAGFENAANSSSETIQLLWKTTLCVHLRRPLDIWSTSLHMVVGDITGKERYTHIWRSKSSWHTRDYFL